MTARTISVTVILMLFFTTVVTAQWHVKPVVQFQKRDGLPNFFHKVAQGAVPKVSFIGGSITASKGWRTETISWLEKQYGIDKIATVNAAISGTNSKYGVFRIDRELLSGHSSDLIFVEFAVNDKSAKPADIARSMEGMVRKIWKADPHTDICFVYTVSTQMLPAIHRGSMNLSASVQDSIAAYYGIPGIFLGTEIDRQLQTDSVVWTHGSLNLRTVPDNREQHIFTRDGVHPTVYGHQVYTSVMATCLKEMEGNTKVRTHVLRPPLLMDNYGQAKMIPAQTSGNHGMSPVDSVGERAYLNKFMDNSSGFLIAEDTAAYYSYSFIGKETGLSLVIGPSTGNFIMEIDSVKIKFRAFDRHCTYWRRSSRFVQLDQGPHSVKLYLSPDTLSVAQKVALLSTGPRKPKSEDLTSRYGRNELIFSDIFIDGKMLGPRDY